MTTKMESDSRQQLLKVIVTAVAVIGLVAYITILFVKSNAGSPRPSIAQEMDLDKHPLPAWVIQDAKTCQGDMTKLNSSEQNRLSQMYPGQSARMVVQAAYSMNR